MDTHHTRARTAFVLFALSLSLAHVARANAPAPAIEGSWRGRLGPEKGGLRLALTITREKDGTRRALLDSLDQNSKIPVESVKLDGAKLTLSVPLLGGGYEGKLDASGKRIEGTWTQRGVPAQPLAFERDTASTTTLKGPPGVLGPTLEAFVPTAPIVLTGAQQRYLVYELNLTNLGHGDLKLVSIEARDPSGAAVWNSDAADLKTRVVRLGRDRDGGEVELMVAPGTRSVVFVWMPCPAKLPPRLIHRIEVREGDGVARKIDVAPTPVLERALELAPPLRGGLWMAANGPGDNSPHRRALLPMPGQGHDAQRYAIDWIRVGDDGKTYKGDPKLNASYLAYGQDAIAVADATVVAIKDGLADNVPGPPPPPTAGTLLGNHVVLDIGNGRRAVYAHLKPGSVQVKVGDKVKRGQRLGLVGNTGNSTEAHLHFHVVEGEDAVAAEGVPYTYAGYESRGTKREDKPTPRAHVLPMQNELIGFAP